LDSLLLDCLMKNKKYDYIICGGGASGLLLVSRICMDPYFKNKSILLIDKESKTTNDRTWCFWEHNEGDLEEIINKRWNHAHFASEGFEMDFPLKPFQYKMIRSIDFYRLIKERLKSYAQLEQTQENIVEIDHQINSVKTAKNQYEADLIFSSIYDPSLLYNQSKYPVLQQHFIGQVIETNAPCFDPDKIEFMNFDIPQKGNTRFMYLLPFSPTKALVEYTLFSKDLLEKEEYIAEIETFLSEIPTQGYKIIEQEEGQIPMTCYRFDLNNTERLLHIGTAGGWTKPSTGFTFQRINEKTKELIQHLKQNKPLDQFGNRNRFWFYDLLFLDVLANNNAEGADLFMRMFKNNTTQTIFKFLDEKSNYWEELKIMRSFKVTQFIKALAKRLF
jgi:lycopene beta-cyclase